MRNIFASNRKRDSHLDLNGQGIGHNLAREEEIFLSGLTETVLPWLREVAYSHGVNRGLHAKKHESYVADIDSRLSDSRFSWAWHHNWLRIVVNTNEDLKGQWDFEITEGTELFLIQPDLFASDFVIFVAGCTEQIANKFFDKARFVNRVTYCQAVGHHLSNREQTFDICVQMGERWGCEV